MKPNVASFFCLALSLAVTFVSCPDEGRMTETEFRDCVYEFLTENYPDDHFEKSDNALIIKRGQAELGLQNLYRAYEEREPTDTELQTMLHEHFVPVMRDLTSLERSLEMDWTEARTKIRVQFMPNEYRGKDLAVYRDVDEYICIGFVLDAGGSYRYVTRDDLERWNAGLEPLYRRAIENLEAATKGRTLKTSLEKERFMAAELGDGFDAARLLLPRMREKAAELLGEPFYAAVPFRDFLIMWARDNSEEFMLSTMRQIEADYAAQPYSLSKNVFIVEQNEIRVKDGEAE